MGALDDLIQQKTGAAQPTALPEVSTSPTATPALDTLLTASPQRGFLPRVGRAARSFANFFTGNTQRFLGGTGRLYGEAGAFKLDENIRRQATEGGLTETDMRVVQKYRALPEGTQKRRLGEFIKNTIVNRTGISFADILPEQGTTSVKKIAGKALGTAAEIAPFGKAAQIIRGAKVLKPSVGKLALTGAKEGAKYGAGFGAAGALQEDADLRPLLVKTLAGAGTGAAAGAVLSPILGKIGQRLGRGREQPQQPQRAISGRDFRKEIEASTVLNKQYADFPKEALFQQNGKLQPQFAKGRIDDVALKLDDMFPGKNFGEKFRTSVDVGNTTLDEMRAKALQLAQQKSTQFPKQPLAPTSRVKQSVAQEAQQKIENDLTYLQRIDELGGGRVKTNPETLAAGVEKVRRGEVTIDTIARHRAGTPVNEDTVAAAAVVKDHYERRWLDALNRGDGSAADEANKVLQKIAPGYNNLTATPGRATQIQSQFGEDRLSQLYQKMRDLQNKGITFEQVQKELDRELKTLRQQEKLGNLSQRAKDIFRSVENYATAAKLTSSVTHTINSISNAATFVTRGLERYTKAGIQLLQGKKTEAAATAKYAFGTGMGFRNGMQRFAATLVGDAPEFGVKAEITETTPGAVARFATRHKKLAVGGRLVNPFRWLAAADNFWKGILQDSELHTKAYTAARAEGLTGKALNEKIASLLKNPPQVWMDDALKVSKEYTFQSDPDRFMSAVLKIRNLPGGRLIVPFVQTPYNIVKFQWQRSLGGVLSPRNITGLAKGGDEAAGALSRLAVGTGLSIGAWQLVQHGNITGAYPTNSKDRALWEAEGRRAYSIKVGDKWISYNRFQPLGLYLTQAAALDDAIRSRDKESAGALFTQMLAQAGKSIMDLPFVQGMSSVIDAIQDPKNYAEKLLSQTVTGFFPNILRDIRQQVDVTQREARGVIPAIKNIIPGISKQLQPKIDILGREKTYEPNRFLRGTKVISSLKETPETRILREVGYSPSELDRGDRILEQEGKSYELSPEEFTQFKKEIGEATLEAIRDAAKISGWEEKDTDEKADTLQSRITAARKRIRNQWKDRKKSFFVKTLSKKRGATQQ